MSYSVTVNRSEFFQVFDHLKRCGQSFIPPLESRVNLVDYSNKLTDNSVRIEAWDKTNLIGLIAVYMNSPSKSSAFITSVSVEKDFEGKGIATQLLTKCIEEVKNDGFKSIVLEVSKENDAANRLYKNRGFILLEDGPGSSVKLVLSL